MSADSQTAELSPCEKAACNAMAKLLSSKQPCICIDDANQCFCEQVALAALAAADSVNIKPDTNKERAKQWWCGKVIPTGNYRLRLYSLHNYRLQQLVADTDGRCKRWVNIATAEPGTSDDE